LLGRKTYAIFATYWPNAPAEVPFTGLLNATRKYAASRTMQAADWSPTTIIRRVPEDVARLKDEHHEIHVSGSGDLVHVLLREELVDRLNLWIYPVVLGNGKRLFDAGPPTNAWRLVTCTSFATGVVRLGYELAGAAVYGDTGLDAAGGDWPPRAIPSRARQDEAPGRPRRQEVAVRFRAKILTSGRTATGIEVPAKVVEALGSRPTQGSRHDQRLHVPEQRGLDGRHVHAGRERRGSREGRRRRR
jgi:dihydrofolate reductase